MKNIKNFSIGVAALYVLVIVALMFGYISNLITFVGLDFKQPYKAEIIRGIGVFSPLGAIIGYLPIQDN